MAHWAFKQWLAFFVGVVLIAIAVQAIMRGRITMGSGSGVRPETFTRSGDPVAYWIVLLLTMLFGVVALIWSGVFY